LRPGGSLPGFARRCLREFRMGESMLATMILIATVSTAAVGKEAEASVQSMLDEESPDVFLAKATLQQYLSRVVRKDWDAARRLTHPKTVAVIRDLKRRVGSERHNLAPWATSEVQLKTFKFVDARQIASGVVAIEVGEDTYRAEEHGMSVDDPAVYLLFKSRGGFLVGDKKAGAALDEVSDASVRVGYPGYVDQQAQVQARREAAFHGGVHR
jgi:hypothetical protein